MHAYNKHISASIVYVYAIAKHKKTRKQVLLRSLIEPAVGLEKWTNIVVGPVSRIKNVNLRLKAENGILMRCFSMVRPSVSCVLCVYVCCVECN